METTLLSILLGICSVPSLYLGAVTKPFFRFMPIYLIAIVVVPLCLRRRSNPLKALLRCPLFYFFVVYMVLGVLSGLAATNGYFFKTALWERFTFAFLPWFIGSVAPRGAKDCLIAMAVYMVSSLGTAFYCATVGVVNQFSVIPGDGGATAHRNFMADIIDSAMFIALTLFLSLKPWYYRLPLFGLLAVLFLGTFSTQSRGGILCLLYGCCVLMLVWSRNLFARLASPILMVAVLCGAVLLIPEERMEERTNVEAGSSAAARPYFWEMSFAYIRENPFTPTGWGNPPVNWVNQKVENYCNFLLQDYIEGGVLAALMSLSIIVSGVVIGIRNYLFFPPRSPERATTLLSIVIFTARYMHGSVETYWGGVWENSIAYYCLGFITSGALVRYQAKDQQRATPTITGPDITPTAS